MRSGRKASHFSARNRSNVTIFRRITMIGLAAGLLLTLACGPSQEELDRRIEAGVQRILASMPTATPIVFPTPLPTITPFPTVTPQPTPTQIMFPPTPTAVATPAAPTPQPTATPQPLPNFEEIHQRVWQSVFLIESSQGEGSGWLVEPNLILTNQHVVGNDTRVTVRQAFDHSITATVLAIDHPRDIALLRFDPHATPLDADAKPLPMGDISTDNIAGALLALGYSGTGVKSNGTVGAASANVGVLSQIINFGADNFGFNLIMDVPVDTGDSGGPVFNVQGEVVGMVRAIGLQSPGGPRSFGTVFAVHVDEIRDALEALKHGESR